MTDRVAHPSIDPGVTAPSIDPARPEDAQLLAWRDAAVGGGLPLPSRADRWQPLRAGLVGLWEFEVAEYWFARGWAQLTGRNETGKSSLMALTTLIPWLGDTSTGNIDTLGEHGKRFRYYVEPTTSDGDRRDSGASTNRGWLWVEYGRLVDGEPRYVTTALYAEARRASTQLTLRWCTAQGPRVRDEITLFADGFVTHAKDLTALPGFTMHARAGDYREWCARTLLGAGTDRLDAVGKLLRVTRTPKLGERLNIAFVSEKMRDALPELDRAEIDALATGWDQLDAVRADAEAARAASSAVARFLRRGWTPWVHARLRRVADDAAAARSAFDNVTRREREARTILETIEAQALQIRRDVDALATRQAAAATALEEVQASTRYADAAGRVQRLEEARAKAVQARASADSASDRRVQAQELADRDEESAGRAEAEVEPRTTARLGATDTVLDRLGAAGMGAQADAVRQHDLARVTQAARERRSAIAQARTLHTDFSGLDRAADARETESALKHRAAQEADTAAQDAWVEAEQSRDALTEAVSQWARGLEPTPAPAIVDTWITTLPVAAGSGRAASEGTSFEGASRREWYEPVVREIADRAAAARQRQDAADATIGEIETAIEALRSARVPSYPLPAGWVRRARPEPGPQGAPLWWLVNPSADAGLDAQSLAHVEAALAAAGLLDAWVSPDGVYRADRDGSDIAVDLPPATQTAGAGEPHETDPTLADVLQVPDSLGPIGPRARQLLAQVVLAAGSDELPATPYAVAQDGRWRTPLLAGRAEPAQAGAEWLGDEARRAGRARRLAQLQERLAAAQAEQEAARVSLAQASADRERVDAIFARRPDTGPLLRLLDRAADRDATAQRAQDSADAATRKARAARELADAARARLLEHAGEHRLPTSREGLEELNDNIHEVERGLGQLAHALEVERAALESARTARDRARESAGRATSAIRAQELSDRDATAAGAAADALAALVDADAREVLDEVDRRRADLRGMAAEHAHLQQQALETERTIGEARQRLSTTEQERAQATQTRDVTFASFRRLVDTGLVAQADIALPQPDSAAVEAVRAQVAATRDAIRIAGWPDDQGARQDVIDRAWSVLVDEGDKARAVLETRGRTLRRVEDEEVPRVEVVVDATGVSYGPREAAARLERIRDDLGRAYDERVQTTLSELLGSTFIEHLRTHLVAMRRLIGETNSVLRDHPTGTTRTALRIRLDAREGATADVLEALEQGTALLDESVSRAVREFLRDRVDGAREDAAARGEAQWGDRLAKALDYRQWFDVSLEKRSGDGGRWTALTPAAYAGLSGGARAVMLMLPLVATLAALYGSMSGSPRPLWLDEAFDGLDAENRAMVLDLLREFDFDVLVAGPGRLVNVSTVPAAAIYQVVRAADPYPGADLTLELWAANTLMPLDLPPATSRSSVSDGRPLPTSAAPDLWSAASAGDEGVP